MFSQHLIDRAATLVETCRHRGLTLATAESCTGGLVAGLITEIAGSSAVFGRGFVTYSNQAKLEMLGVDDAILRRDGAVSEACARAMAAGALARAGADIAVSVTGIAGPGGGTQTKPVGLVHFGCAMRDRAVLHAERRFGPLRRSEIRLASVEQTLALLHEALAANA